MNIEPMRTKHIDDAVLLVTQRYREERAHLPILPDEDLSGAIAASLAGLLRDGCGVAAVQGGALSGFLAGMPIDAFFGACRGVFVPLHGHGAGGDRRDVYQRLYEAAAGEWVANGCLTHAVMIFAHDREALHTWFDAGFGNRCVDAMRPLEPVVGGVSCDCEIRLVTEDDAEAMLPVFAAHHRYYAGSPLFMPVLSQMRLDDARAQLTTAGRHTWGAFVEGRAVAEMAAREGGENFIADCPDTLNACSAFALPEARGRGIAAAMLDRVVRWGKERGYARLGVDYEAFNRLGSRFWGRHFAPYTHSVVRRIDERVLWAHARRLEGVVI